MEQSSELCDGVQILYLSSCFFVVRENKMQSLLCHVGCNCELIPFPAFCDDTSYTIMSHDIKVGHFEWCPVMKQWTIEMAHGVSFTKAFIDKVWTIFFEMKEESP